MKRNTIRAIDGARYQKLIDRLGLSQRGAARFFGIDDRTSRRYADDSTPVDPRTAMLLEIMVKYEITPEDALRLIGIKPGAAAKAAAAEGKLPRYYDNLRS